MTTDNTNKTANELKTAGEKSKEQAAQVADNAAAANAKEPTKEVVKGGDDVFSLKRSLVLLIGFPIGVIVGWAVVAGTGGLGFEAKEEAAAAQALTAKAPEVDPVAEEARRVASETAERVATRVSTDVATRVARDVASKVARDTAIKAIENVQ